MSRTVNRNALLQTVRGKTRRFVLVSTWIDTPQAADQRFPESCGVSVGNVSPCPQRWRMMAGLYVSVHSRGRVSGER